MYFFKFKYVQIVNTDTTFVDVNEVWAGKLQNTHVILSKTGPYKLFCLDIARIAPNQELESEVGLIVIFLCYQCKISSFAEFCISGCSRREEVIH